VRGVLRLDELYYGVLLFLRLLCVFYSFYYVLLSSIMGPLFFSSTTSTQSPLFLPCPAIISAHSGKRTRAYVTESKERVRHQIPAAGRNGTSGTPSPATVAARPADLFRRASRLSGDPSPASPGRAQPREPARLRTRTHPFLSADSFSCTCLYHPIPYPSLHLLCTPCIIPA
jgi:hypothetical protein